MNDLLGRLMLAVSGPSHSRSQLRELADLLAVSFEEVNCIPTNPRLGYHPFTVRKRDGSRRQIVAPSSPLKLLQRRLLHRYLAAQPLHEAATAFRSGHSIATHARRHLGQQIVLTVDMADFFPSTAAARVRAWFRDLGWRDEALQALMRLCTYRGGLPQGAPTSPALSNLVNLPLDERLSELAARHGGRYSRYCDDLAFSWSIDAEPGAFRNEVEDCLRRFRYQVQVLKGWRLQCAEQDPEITGLVLAGRRLRLSQAILQRYREAKSRFFFRQPTNSARIQGYRGLQKMLK